MTNKEAINILKDMIDYQWGFSDMEKSIGIDALEMAIEALENQSSVIEELEKIKHEIGNEFVDLQDGSEEWRSYVNDAVLSCYEIVDKQIMALKGELLGEITSSKENPFGKITNSKGVLEQIAEEQKTLLDTTKAWSKALERGDIY